MFSTRIFIIWTIWITIISCKVTGQKNQPNVVLILTDDLDLLQGGMNPLNKTRNLIGDAGITFENSFVSTPICCPSRSSILTGKYQHNTRVYNNTVVGGCNSEYWRNELEPQSISTTAQEYGYETYYAGKYLNQYGFEKTGGPEHIPKGWNHWYGLSLVIISILYQSDIIYIYLYICIFIYLYSW